MQSDTCGFCQARFSSLSMLLEHVSVHLNPEDGPVVPVECTLCPEWFFLGAGYRFHLKTDHKDFEDVGDVTEWGEWLWVLA